MPLIRFNYFNKILNSLNYPLKKYEKNVYISFIQKLEKANILLEIISLLTKKL